MYGVIGVLDWWDCNTCIHSDEEVGGCDVPDVNWEAVIKVENDEVLCAYYKHINDVE